MTTLALTPRTANVTRVFRSATDAQVEKGMDWYAAAQREAAALADSHGVTLPVATGIIAALSPMNSWGANLSLADRFLAAGGLHEGYLSVGLAKARRILAGDDILTVLHSEKVSAFYGCIVAGGITDVVCVDRHASDIAWNTRLTDSNRPKATGRRYAAIADTYVRAGAILGLPAAQVQAVTWVTWRNRFWADGAFDPREAAA